jgi:DNA repair protein RadA/Sms
MSAQGLVEVADPSQVLLAARHRGDAGSAVVPVLEGSRPLLMEVQALTAPSSLAVPRRVANGVDSNRLVLLTAVLTRRAGLALSNQDVIVNVVGGLRVSETAADLAVALAVASAFSNIPLEPEAVAFGEVGLSGEVRPVPQAERRLQEAARLGFSQAFLPLSARGEVHGFEGMKITWAETLAQAIRLSLGPRRAARVARVESEEDSVPLPDIPGGVPRRVHQPPSV